MVHSHSQNNFLLVFLNFLQGIIGCISSKPFIKVGGDYANKISLGCQHRAAAGVE
jgi:hypothetical protein